MKTTHFLLAFFLIVASAFSHIGETYDQCVVRYGTPVEKETGKAAFRKNGFLIITSFGENGKCDVVFYNKGEKNAVGLYEELSDVEVQGLLNANGTDWKKIGSSFTSKTYATEDNKIFGAYDTFRHVVEICTMEWIEKNRAQEADQQKSSVQGL
jgi:hypothetical protein